MKGNRYLLFCLLIFIALVSLNFFYGITDDDDSTSVINKALRGTWDTPSRTWGFPAYELFIYPIIYYLGLTTAKFYSFIFSLGTVIVFWFILKLVTEDRVKLFLGTLSFVLLPITIINGNSIMDTSQALFFALLGLFFYLRFAQASHARDFYFMVIALGLATSTRPDYILLSGLIALVALWFQRPALKLIVIGTALWLLFALLPFAIYDSWSPALRVVVPDPIERKLLRAALGYLALFGIPAVLFISLWLITHRRAFGKVSANLWALSGITFGFFGLRFIALPDELEYVYIMVPLVILLLVTMGMGQRALAALAIAIFIPNLVQLYFFERSPTGELSVSVGLSPGAIAQDRSRRLLKQYIRDELPLVFQEAAASLGVSNVRDKLYTTPGSTIFIAADGLRFIDPDRMDGMFYKAACQQTIFVYPMSNERFWRRFIAFEEWSPVESNDFEEVTFPHCTSDAQ